MAYATTDDVSARLGRELDESEVQIVAIRLDDVERLIKARIPDLDGMILDSEIDEGTVVMIEAEAVLRLIRNQDGYSSETDGNYTYSISARVASGHLVSFEQEWALLGVRRGAFVIAPRVSIPTHYKGPHPARCFGPQVPEQYPVHPAVWWGDDESS